MATNAKHGKNAYFSLGGSSLTTYLTSIDISETTDMAETSAMGQNSKSYIPGMKDTTISLSGWYSGTAAGGPDAVIAPLKGTATPTAFEYGPAGTASSEVKYTGSAFVTSYAVSSPAQDTIAFSAELQVSGDVTRTTF